MYIVFSFSPIVYILRFIYGIFYSGMLLTHALPQIYTKFLNKKIKIKNTANNLPPASSYAHRQEIIFYLCTRKTRHTVTVFSNSLYRKIIA